MCTIFLVVRRLMAAVGKVCVDTLVMIPKTPIVPGGTSITI